jgi:hypothetical protein
MAIKLMIVDTEDILTTGLFALPAAARRYGLLDKSSWL